MKLKDMSTVLRVQAHNNAHLGYKRYGGELYNRVSIKFNITNGNILQYKANYYVPSGYGDGNIAAIIGEVVLKPNEIKSIQKNGLQSFCKSKFLIKDILDSKSDSPFRVKI